MLPPGYRNTPVTSPEQTPSQTTPEVKQQPVNNMNPEQLQQPTATHDAWGKPYADVKNIKVFTPPEPWDYKKSLLPGGDKEIYIDPKDPNYHVLLDKYSDHSGIGEYYNLYKYYQKNPRRPMRNDDDRRSREEVLEEIRRSEDLYNLTGADLNDVILYKQMSNNERKEVDRLQAAAGVKKNYGQKWMEWYGGFGGKPKQLKKKPVRKTPAKPVKIPIKKKNPLDNLMNEILYGTPRKQVKSAPKKTKKEERFFI